ncbi:MAG: hypothetical protein QM570_16980 [Planctomycetota bacterium]|nr:hypothetical protein [Planctomycetota bacterium]
MRTKKSKRWFSAKGLFHHTMDPPYIKDRYEESILVIEAESEE